VDFEPLNPFAPDYELKKNNFDYIKNNTVNLFNASSMGAPDETEAIRLLRALDLNVNVYAEYTSPDDFRKISLAGLNISMCNVHDDYLATYLEEKYGIPYLIHNMPLGIAATGNWLLEVAKRLGREGQAKRLIKAEEADLNRALSPIKSRLAGKRVIVNGGVIRVALLAVMLKDLGMKVITVRPYHFDNLSEDIFAGLEEELPDVDINVAPGQVSEFMNILLREKPDLCISHGGTNAWVTKAGIPSVPLFSPGHTYFGYRGVFEQARHFAKLLENSALQKNLSRNIKLPYSAAWLAKNPYHYIDDSSLKEIK
jgi:nitrogenase molybdenum-iron protein alpha chain